MNNDLLLHILSLTHAIASTQQRIADGEKLDSSLQEYLEALQDVEQLVSEKELLRNETHTGQRHYPKAQG